MSTEEPRLIDGGLAVDERGVVRFVNAFAFEDVKRFYTIENHEVGYIRAWHGHWKEAKYIYVASGAAVIGVGDMQTNVAKRYVLSAEKPQILYVPPGYANGSMSLVPNTVIVHFSTHRLGEAEDDDIRLDLWEFNDIWRLSPR